MVRGIAVVTELEGENVLITGWTCLIVLTGWTCLIVLI
jgi:hypothetical protein